MSTFQFEGRPPADAVAYFERQTIGGKFSFDWRDVEREEHSAAFVVAKMGTADLLADTHAALLQAIKDGKSREQFVAELTPILKAKGWWGKQVQTDPLTGEDKLVQLGSPRRLRTIYDWNMRFAHSDGRWQRFERNAATRPFLQRRHTPQEHPRILHESWDGIIVPWGHPMLKTHWTPDGPGCKCTWLSLRSGTPTSEDELTAKGIYKTRPLVNKRTGEIRQVPVGIDWGFDYNVGQARLASLVPPQVAPPQLLDPTPPASSTPQALPTPRKPPAGLKRRPELATPAAAFEALSKALGTAQGEAFIDKAGLPVVIGQRMFDAPIGPNPAKAGDRAGALADAEILAAALLDPDEIWHTLKQREDGTSVLIRTFVAAFIIGAVRELVTASITARDGIWWRSAPLKANPDAEDRRSGALVYRRK